MNRWTKRIWWGATLMGAAAAAVCLGFGAPAGDETLITASDVEDDIEQLLHAVEVEEFRSEFFECDVTLP
jgi:hypothetical protein